MAANAQINILGSDKTASAFASVQRSMDKLGEKTKEMNGNFLGKGLLAGLGVGGGFQAAQTLVDSISKRYEEAAKFAQDIEESTKRTLDYTLRAIKAAQTPEQQLGVMLADQKRIIAEREKAQAPVMFMAPAQPGSFFDESKKAGMREAGKTNEQKLRIAELIEAEAKLGEEITKLQKQITEATEKNYEKIEALRMADQERSIRAKQAGLSAMENETAAMIAEQTKRSDLTAKERESAEKLAESYRSIADPARQFTKQIEEANKLAADGKITFTQAAEAVDVLTRAMNDAAQSRVDRALGEFFGDIDEEARRINDLSKEMTSLKYASLVAGEMIAGSFEDAILSGRALGDVLRSLGQDLLRLVFQQTITAPLASAITGGITGFFGGARAAGGPVSTGSSYMVGENGPELFVPSTAGRILNEHQMGGGGGGGGGSPLNFIYNIASGVTRAELKPILDQQRAQLRREIPDAVRRGGSYRTAFA